MAYNEKLADRIRERLAEVPKVDEKQMMGGLIFMVNDKMCIGIMKDEMMCRIDREIVDTLLEKPGCRIMTLEGKRMKGCVLIDETGMKSSKDFEYWVALCLDFNKRAKRSKRK
ncbi:TfoX/Sxy family protein [Chryseosolibacter indicus]|uniref:TfoX/Sxy family protein n=1 Tax=Chryseosolibacter indicus TaxID=2782351 RepID=A0ABS5VQN7_9BACT|nr:TfoX/Sxy family protein [Chryseosolibacter indicus]MBT1703765.1 TfoX/Sxy family protein [Chryseosolibacter indicus]